MDAEVEVDGGTPPPPAPPSVAWKSLADYLSLVGSRYIGMLVGAVRALIIPGLLDPAGYGIYKTLLLIPVFVKGGHLGAVSGLSRQIPFYRGKRDTARLDLSVRVAYSFSIGSALIASLLVGAYAIFVAVPPMRYLLLIFLVFIVAEQQSAFRETYLLGFERFQLAARLRLAQNLLTATLAIIGTWLFGLTGLVVSISISSALCLVMFRIASGVGFPGLSFDRSTSWELLSVGAPLLVTGLLYNLFFTMDRLIIVNMLGAVAMGQYALAVTMVGYINDLTTLFSRIIFPKMVARIGSGESATQVARYVHLPMTGASYVFPIGMIAVHYAAVWGFRWVFPKYEPGAGALEILAFGTLMYTHYLVYMNLVVAMKRQTAVMWIFPMAAAVAGVFAVAAVRLDYGIEGVAMGTAVGFLALSVSLCAWCETKMLESRGALPRIFKSYGPAIYLAALVAADHGLFGQLGASPVADGLRALGVLLFYVPVLFWAWRRDEELRGIVAMLNRARGAI